MPMYEYECDECHERHESFKPISDRNDPVYCKCGSESRRIIIAQIQRNEPTWLPDAINHAIPHGSNIRVPNDRNEFNSYLKENGIAHAE